MNQENLENLTDEELKIEAKKLKKASIINATLIGFLLGVLVYSIWVNSIGFLSILPLLLLLKLANPKKNKALKKLLKERNIPH